MSDFEILDLNEKTGLKKRSNDKFMKIVYILLIILAVTSSLVYFFGYEALKPFIKV